MLSRGYKPVDYLLLLAISAIWGSSFLFIKVAVATIPPMTVVAARLALAALVLLVILYASGGRLPRDPRVWRDFLVVAVVGSVVPFFLINWGEITIDSSLAAILMASMPLVTMVLAHFFTKDDRISRGRGLGMTVGLGGVMLLIGPDALSGLGREVAAQLAVTAGACCYAISTVYTRSSRLTELPALTAGAGVLVCATVVSLPLALVIDRPWPVVPDADSIAALLALSLLCTAAAYLILFRLIASTSATFTATLNYLIPVFGLVWGVAMLGERLRLDALAALVLILVGVAPVQARRSNPRP